MMGISFVRDIFGLWQEKAFITPNRMEPEIKYCQSLVCSMVHVRRILFYDAPDFR